ncbi:MAG: shikimate dehydrogenase [Bacteroidales bacterium]|nr:shikimate dehydrogenase [Bacteroidales bacterium]
MKLYGLIGYPLGHSFSKKYFTEKFEKEGIDAKYELFPIESIEKLPDLLLSHSNLCGFNVTIPYKEQVIPYLDEMDEDAKAVGAFNVVKVTERDGRKYLKGYNSDTYGFRESLRPLLKPTHKKALILGTGGASKAVYSQLVKLGIEPTYVSRKPADGRLTYQDLTAEVMRNNLVIVNASPVGMSPNVDQCPDIPYEMLTAEYVCFDLVYNPEETLFLRKAAERGATTKNGLEMLQLQAEGAWAIWNREE